MAYEEMATFARRTVICGATSLAAKQFYAIRDANGGAVLASAGKNIDGILVDPGGVGKACTIVSSGIVKAAISASTALTGGTTLLEVDSGGTLKPAAGGTVVAIARESLTSTAAVCLVAVQLLPNNSPFV